MAEPHESTRAPLGAALAQAIARLRAQFQDPFAPITVVVPSSANGTLARRALAAEGPFLRVWFQTPEELARAEAPDAVWAQGLRREPPAWLHATLGALLPRLASEGKLGRHEDTLLLPGWRAPLVAAVQRLESEGLTSQDLDDEGALPHVRERVALLRHLLEAVEEARREGRLLAPGALEGAAHDVVGARQGVAASAATGAVILGDHTLAAPVFRYLRAWLKERPCVRLDVRPFSHLTPAPRGLVRACPAACEVVPLAPAAPQASALAALQAGLYTTPAPAPLDTSVVFARPPDEVRECTECVREVQRAIRKGTPLDRIALVLPDMGPVEALRESLERAGIPASWLVSSPLRQLPAAQLLHLALDVAAGDETLRAWYELLRHPALRLKGHAGIDPVEGKGRWRRLLSRCGWARGTKGILAALQEQLDELDELDREAKPDTPRKQAALSSLLRAIHRLDEALAPLREPATLGEHGARWTRFLRTFAKATLGRGELISSLQSFGPAGSGPWLSLAGARVELSALTEARVQQGRLTDRAVKVLSPMHLLGGGFDLICLLGLTQRRFPSPVAEEPLLSDEVLLHLGRGREGEDALRLAKEHEDVERRRFTAALSAATGRVWLSSPAAEFEAERPSVPSPFLLDALTALRGERARFKDLEGAFTKAGSRSRVVPDVAADALGAAEHLAARVASSPAALLPVLASHPTSRRLLQLHRSMHRVAHGAEPDPWTGFVDPTLLPCPGLDEAPLSLRDLLALLTDPGRFFFRQILGARPAPRLVPWGAPLKGRAFRRLLLAALDEVLTQGAAGGSDAERLAHAQAAFHEKLDDAVDAAIRHAQVPDDEREAALEVGRALGSMLLETQNRLLGTPRSSVEGAPIDAELPWRVSGEPGRLYEDGGAGRLVVLTDADAPPGPSALASGEARDLTLAGLAHRQVGGSVDDIEVLTVSGEGVPRALDKAAAKVLEALHEVTEDVRAGRYRVGRDRAFGLAADARAGAFGDNDDDSTSGDGA